MAPRSLMLMPITFDCMPVASLSSSPNVVASMRWGDMWPAVLLGSEIPTVCTEASEAQYTELPEPRSYQSLPMMPWERGVVPVKMDAWPGPVYVGA